MRQGIQTREAYICRKHFFHPVYRLLLLAFLLPAGKTVAQKPQFRYVEPQYELEYLPLHSRTDIGTINDAVEDDDGFIWLSSTTGIHVFDGSNLISYTNGDPAYPVKSKASVESYGFICKDNNNLLHFQEVAGNSIIGFDPRLRKVQYEQRSWPMQLGLLSRVCIAPSGNFLSFYRSADKRSGFIFKGWQSPSNAPLWETEALHLLSRILFSYVAGYYWMVVDNKVVRISNDTYTVKNYQLSAPGLKIDGIAAVDDHLYLTSYQNRCIYIWNPEKDTFEAYLHLPGNIEGGAFGMDRRFIYQGNNSAFYIIDRKEHTIQDLTKDLQVQKYNNNKLMGTNICKILFTRSNGIFLVTDQSLVRLKNKQPLPEKYKEKINVNAVLSFRQLTEDPESNLYASYYVGVAVKKKGSKSFVPLFPWPILSPAGHFSAYSLNYWKGYLLWNNVQFDPSTLHYHTLGPNATTDHTAQYLDKDSLWFYTWWTDFLFCYDLSHKSLSSFPIRRILSQATEVNAITSDASGQYLWLATKGDGIVLIDKKGRLVKRYAIAALGLDDQFEPAVNTLQPSAQGLWFGSNKGLGLIDARTEKVSLYPAPGIRNAPLQNRVIYSIITDETGNLYLGSNSGILYFDTRKKAYHTLPSGHPLEMIECNRASAFHASDGRYYFGTTSGLYSFRPEELIFNKLSGLIKPIKLDNISLFNAATKSYKNLGAFSDSSLTLHASDNSIDIHLSLPEYDEAVYYAYRLSGPDSKWSEYRQDNRIFLSYLPSGKHTLEIKASADLSDNNASLYRLNFQVDQIWYKKIWVIILLCLTISTGILLMIRYRFNQKYQRQKELGALRTRISSDLHDDIGSVLSGLAMQSEMLTYTAREEQKQPLIEISNMSRDIMESMRDIVWAMDSRKDHYENLVDRMRSFAEKSFGMRNIEHEFLMRDIDNRKFIDPEKRQNIYLIFKEAITNILKHSNASFVQILLEQQGDRLLLCISDNGHSAAPFNPSGLGIGNMTMRAKRIGGSLNISQEQGFRIELVLPHE